MKKSILILSCLLMTILSCRPQNSSKGEDREVPMLGGDISYFGDLSSIGKSDNGVYVGTQDGTISLIKQKNKSYPIQFTKSNGDRIYSILEYEQKYLFVGQRNNGVSLIVLDSPDKCYTLSIQAYNKGTEYSPYDLTLIPVDESEDLLVCGTSNGLYFTQLSNILDKSELTLIQAIGDFGEEDKFYSVRYDNQTKELHALCDHSKRNDSEKRQDFIYKIDKVEGNYKFNLKKLQAADRHIHLSDGTVWEFDGEIAKLHKGATNMTYRMPGAIVRSGDYGNNVAHEKNSHLYIALENGVFKVNLKDPKDRRHASSACRAQDGSIYFTREEKALRFNPREGTLKQIREAPKSPYFIGHDSLFVYAYANSQIWKVSDETMWPIVELKNLNNDISIGICFNSKTNRIFFWQGNFIKYYDIADGKVQTISEDDVSCQGMLSFDEKIIFFTLNKGLLSIDDDNQLISVTDQKLLSLKQALDATNLSDSFLIQYSINQHLKKCGTHQLDFESILETYSLLKKEINDRHSFSCLRADQDHLILASGDRIDIFDGETWTQYDLPPAKAEKVFAVRTLIYVLVVLILIALCTLFYIYVRARIDIKIVPKNKLDIESLFESIQDSGIAKKLGEKFNAAVSEGRCSISDVEAICTTHVEAINELVKIECILKKVTDESDVEFSRLKSQYLGNANAAKDKIYQTITDLICNFDACVDRFYASLSEDEAAQFRAVVNFRTVKSIPARLTLIHIVRGWKLSSADTLLIMKINNETLKKNFYNRSGELKKKLRGYQSPAQPSLVSVLLEIARDS